MACFTRFGIGAVFIRRFVGVVIGLQVFRIGSPPCFGLCYAFVPIGGAIKTFSLKDCFMMLLAIRLSIGTDFLFMLGFIGAVLGKEFLTVGKGIGTFQSGVLSSARASECGGGWRVMKPPEVRTSCHQ